MGCCASRLPFEEPCGDYKEISYLEMRGDAPSTPAFMVFYPSEMDARTGSGQKKKIRPYFREKIRNHGITFEINLKYLLCLGCRMEQPFPARAHGEPLKGKQFPLVLFSHGLFGSMEMYSEICRNLASMGMVVVAIEHEDGSACYAQNKDSEDIWYKPPPSGITYSDRDQVRAFRKPMLETRTEELCAVVKYFHAVKKASSSAAGKTDAMLPPPPPVEDCTPEELLGRILLVSDLEKIQLSGHSFGAASTVKTVHHTTTNRPILLDLGEDDRQVFMDLNIAIPKADNGLGGSEVQTRICLDLWPWCLSEDVCATEKCQVPSLFLESHAFMRGKEVVLTKQIAKRTQGLTSFGYLKDSNHQQFADPPLWWPAYIGTRLNTSGAVDRHVAYRGIVTAIAGFVDHVRDEEDAERNRQEEEEDKEDKPALNPDGTEKGEWESFSSVPNGPVWVPEGHYFDESTFKTVKLKTKKEEKRKEKKVPAHREYTVGNEGALKCIEWSYNLPAEEKED